MQNYTKIVVCGHPNVGKTLLINKITGSNLRVGNFPGVTVEKSEISMKYQDKMITFIDIPGIYNSESFSEDEEIAIDFIKNKTKEYDVLLCVGDAMCLEKTLLFVSEIEKITNKPKIIALNLLDTATKHGIDIDIEKIQQKTGYTTVGLDAKSGKNINKLLEILAAPITINKINFDNKTIASECVSRRKITGMSRTHISSIIDNVVLNKYFGMPIFLGIMFGVFALTFWLGQIPSDFLEGTFTNCIQSLGDELPKNIINSMFFEGIIPGVIAALSFLPRIAILFFCISILEKSGYMARISFLMDGFLRIFGISGKSAIPLISGFGCSIPAYMSARILSNKYQKMATMVAIGFIPCSAKMTVLVLLTAAFFSSTMAPFVMLAIYITGFILGLFMAGLVSWSFKNEVKSDFNLLIMELPEYRWPQFSLIKNDVMPRVIAYIKNAGTMIAGVSFALWLFCNIPYNPFDAKYWESRKTISIATEQSQITEAKEYILLNSITGEVGKISGYILSPLGFDWKMNICLLAAVAAKEVALGTLGVLYQVDSDDDSLLTDRIRKEIPFASGISFMIFMLVYTPCISAMAVFAKESKSKKYTIIVIIGTTILAWILSFVGYNIVY